MRKRIIAALLCLILFSVAYGQVANQTVSVMLTNGDVESFSGGPDISFDGSNIIISGETFATNAVQRLVYGKTEGKKFKKNADNGIPAMFIYRNDGQFNAFARADVRQVVHSGNNTEVMAADSTYTIPTAVIDSIGLHRFATVYAKKVVLLDEYLPYIQNSDSLSISFKSSLPKKMQVHEGDILLYESFSDELPMGFAGRVTSVDGNSVSCEYVGFDDIYERAVLFVRSTSDRGNDVAMIDNKSMHGPLPVGIDFNNDFPLPESSISLSEEKGPVKASFKGKLRPYVSFSLVKKSITEKAVYDMHLCSDYSLFANVSLKGKGEQVFNGPSFPIIPTTPLGPITVGLNVETFLKFNVKANASASGSHSGRFVVFLHGEGTDVSVKPMYIHNGTRGTAEGAITGNVSVGLEMAAKAKLAGSMAGIEASFTFGQDLSTTIDVYLPEDKTVYDAIKDDIVEQHAFIELEAKAYAKIAGEDKKKKADTDWRVKANEWYWVPEFTDPWISPKTVSHVGLESQASRRIFMPVNIGWEIQKDGDTAKKSPETKDYSNNYYAVIQHNEGFDDFEYDVKYTAIPTVTIFGQELRANPTKDFIIKAEVLTGDYSNIDYNSATIEGFLPDSDIDCFEWGLRYAPVDTENWKYIKKPGKTLTDDGMARFTADLTGLTENRVYQYQAYMRFWPSSSEKIKDYYGEVKSFLTKKKEMAYQNKVKGPLELDYPSAQTLATAAVNGEALADYQVYVAKKINEYNDEVLKIKNPDPTGEISLRIKNTVDERLRTGYCESLLEKKMTKAQMQKLQQIMMTAKSEADYGKIASYMKSIGLLKDFEDAENRVHLYDGLLTEEEIALKDCNMDSLYRVADSKLESVHGAMTSLWKNYHASQGRATTEEEEYRAAVKFYTQYLPLRAKADSIYRAELLPYYRLKDIHDNVWLKLTGQAPADFMLGEQYRFTWVHLMSYMNYPGISDNLQEPASEVFEEWGREHYDKVNSKVRQYYDNIEDAQRRIWGDY